jgi:hypothetical protein
MLDGIAEVSKYLKNRTDQISERPAVSIRHRSDASQPIFSDRVIGQARDIHLK